MASETIYGYFGKKGAGKTHELVKVIINLLLKGRYVVAVLPQLSVDAVVQYLGDETVRDRLVVCDYTDLETNPLFFPNEDLIRQLQLWKKGDPIPADAHRWRESVWIPGSALVLDEAWRYLENAKELKEKAPGLKIALHMARHYHGPADWRDPEMVKRYKDPNWFPGLGGPEYDVLPAAQPPYVLGTETPLEGWEKQEDDTWRRYRGGDGTPMSTANVLFASQNFFGLARGLREHIDQTTQLVSVRDDYFPTLLKKATDGKEQYMAYTFEAADMPTRQQMLASMNKGEVLWLTEQTVTHDPAIHALYPYASGYAKETRVDDKADLKNNPHWKKMKRGAMILLLVLGFGVALAVYGASKLTSGSELVEQTSGQTVDGSKTAGDARTASNGPSGVQRPADRNAPPLLPSYAGRIGNTIVAHDGYRYAWVRTETADELENGGYAFEIEGHRVDTQTNLNGSDRVGDSRRRLGSDAAGEDGSRSLDARGPGRRVTAEYERATKGISGPS